MDNKDYLSCAETAKLIRAALKRAFPGAKFSVRSNTYSGGASIDIGWTDGPIPAEVEAVTGAYSGADFDGMIDLKTYNDSWLLPDGSVAFASTPGTVGSRGVIPAADNPAPVPGARRVHFGADYVFAQRDVSAALAALAKVYADAHPLTNYHLNPGEVSIHIDDEDRTAGDLRGFYTGYPEQAYRYVANAIKVERLASFSERWEEVIV